MEGVNALAGAGYAPLAAMILSARGLNTPQAAHRYLDCSCPLDDPFLLTDMDLAAGRVGLAMAKGEKSRCSATMTWTASPPPAC